MFTNTYVYLKKDFHRLRYSIEVNPLPIQAKEIAIR